MRVLSQGQCKIKYDDGDSWTGDGRYIMRLDGGQGASSLFCQLYVSVCQRSKTCPLALVSALSSTVVQVVAPGPVLAAAHAVAPVTATVVTATCEPVIFDAKVRRPRMLLRGWALLQ